MSHHERFYSYIFQWNNTKYAVERSTYIANYIKGLRSQRLYPFGEDFADVLLDPKLVIHGGDISHMWSCSVLGCRSTDLELEIYNTL